MRANPEPGIREDYALDVRPHLSHWEGAQVLLSVIRNGSLRRAAAAMSISVVIARRRIEELEREVGAQLFVRDRRGTRLTAEGESVFATVERMEAASLDLQRTQNSLIQSLSGPVRIRVPDSLGSPWLTPRIGEFQRAFPKVLIDLDCTVCSPDEALKDTDVVLTLGRPVHGAIQRRVGRVHFLPFASRRYIEIFGLPASIEEAFSHRWLSHVGGPADFVKDWFPDVPVDDLPVMKTNASSAHYSAVSQGIGLGALPTYLCVLGIDVQPVDIGLKHAADVWLSCHLESKRFPRVSRMADWLVEAFNPAKLPWFRDEFIHPDRLADLYKGAPLPRLFETCSSGGR